MSKQRISAPGVVVNGVPVASEQSIEGNVATDDDAAKTLVDLNPDYVLRVLYPKDKKSNSTDLEAVTHIKIILKLLYNNGFVVEARPDANDQFILLFVTLKEEAFEKLVELSNATDKVFGVKANPTSDEKIPTAERLRLINLHLTLSEHKGGCGLKVGVHNIKAMFPVKHISKLDAEYKSNFGSLGKVFNLKARNQDIIFLNKTLGTAYSLYYKFVQAYVSSIGCLGLVGIGAWWFLGSFSISYALANLFIGLTTYLCIYAGEKKTANEWGLHHINKAEIVKVDDENIEPHWKILLRQIMFIPVIVIGATMLFLAQFACFLLEIFINEIYEGPFQSILSLVPTVIVCVAVPVGTAIFSAVASVWIGFENNATYQSENKSLLTKLFTFDCLASYAALTITSFIYLPLGYLVDPYLSTLQAMFTKASNVYTYVPRIQTKTSEYQVNNLRLSSQMFYFMVINQIIGFAVEHGLPLVLAMIFNVPAVGALMGNPKSLKTLDLKSLDEPKEYEYLQNVRSKIKLPVSANLNAEYKQHVIQYGFLMLFGPIWPLSSIICFLFGVLQQECDFLKFIKLTQPAVPYRAENSAPWVNFMRTLLLIGSFVSMAITLMYNQGIDAAVGKSSTSVQWFQVLPFSLLSFVVMHSAIHLFEKVIDNIYDENQSQYLENEKKVSSIFNSMNEKRSNVKDFTHELSRIDDLMEVLRK